MWGKIGDWLVDFVYPKDCVGCGKSGEWLCGKCRVEFEEVEQICPVCGRKSAGGYVHKKCSKKLGMDGLTVVYEYDERVMKSFIFKVKFEFNKEMLEELVSLLDFSMGKKFDVVVPVPLSIYRRNWRGFNQNRVIADEVGRQLGVPVVEVLKRVGGAKQQLKIKNRKGKIRDVKGMFEAGEVKGKAILLVDDVFSGGATMREVSKVLKKAGASFVWGLVLVMKT